MRNDQTANLDGAYAEGQALGFPSETYDEGGYFGANFLYEQQAAPPVDVPEPASLAIALLGLAGLASARRRG